MAIVTVAKTIDTAQTFKICICLYFSVLSYQSRNLCNSDRFESAMFGGQTLGDQVYRLVDAWIPEKAYRTEGKFRDDLKRFLEDELSRAGGGMFDQRQTYSNRKERGRARADITVDDQVGIELKRDLGNSGIDRLVGQIRKYQKDYPYIIVCACGLKETGGWNELKQEYEGSQGTGLGFGPGSTIRFVEKVNDGREFRSSGSSRGSIDDFGNLDDFGNIDDFGGLDLGL